MLFNFPFTQTISDGELVKRNYASQRDFVCPRYFTVADGKVTDWVGNIVGTIDIPNLPKMKRCGISEGGSGWVVYTHLAVTEETNHLLEYAK